MWLRFLLLSATVPLTSARNRLLENYANKLSSISDRLEWRRIPEIHRLKRYRCIEEYVDERGNVIGKGEEHLTTVRPTKAEIRRVSGKSGQANEVGDV
ncbi:hypothetical protein KIN20_022911 [Parelaphostrongylus tenuis]|uniref:Uncharacterized protein n=1 Tax=Parelaphostrongylus tenuis TaxID=148309 RepID=A0AAD5QV33_PARTN|nr:hypothetical protein KIN20_022911 [Parelaphostrongylus tenuis]